MSALVGMPAKRQTPKKTLDQYRSETLTIFRAIEDFCDKQEKWSLKRKEEVTLIKEIKDRARPEGFKKFLTAVTGDSRRQGFEKELGDVLKGTLKGLEELQPFLEAVEKLAFTSLYAFTDDHHLPRGTNAADVLLSIRAARMAAPLVIHFKRDNKAFLLPSLNNVEVFTFQLEKYIDISKQLCEKLKKRPAFREKSPNVSEDSNGELIQVESIPGHLDQLVLLRNDPNLRLTLLFQEKAEIFINEFSLRCTELEQFLSDLKDTEKKLDNLKFGASISTVAGSSVGVAGGICSIVGLALAPVTAGASLALTLTGVGLGITSGVNSLVTGITEVAVNKHHGKNVDSMFKNFVKNMQELIEILEEVAEGNINGSEKAVESDMADNMDAAVEGVKAGGKAFGIGKGIDALVDGAAAVKVLQGVKVAADMDNIDAAVEGVKAGGKAIGIGKGIDALVDGAAAVKVVRAADLSDIGQMAKGTPLALSKAARSGFIALNALFIGVDVFFICKEGMNLFRGSKNELAQIIRSRVDLWRSELESWSRIHESLRRGAKRHKRSQIILTSRFSPNAVY